MLNNPNTPPGSPSGQTPPGEPTPPGQTPPTTPPGQTPGQPPANQRTPFEQLPLDVQDYIKSLRDEAKTTRQQLEAEAKAKQQAEDERKKVQGQWEALAKQHEARVQELEPVATRYSQLADLVGVQIETEIKDWPPEVKTFDPGTGAPIEQRLEWRNKSRPLIDKLVQQAQGQLPGNRPNPSPRSGDRSFEERVAANYEEMKKSGIKRMF